ncbi:MAG: hypothetical protein N3A61_03210 [Ignavibacteria bacterium]|nr:hypothetical protein [Ignavibacteria bacterium]
MFGQETLLTIIALVILSLIILWVNSSLLSNTTTRVENKSAFQIISIGERLIEEAKLKKFDERVLNSPIYHRDSLTAAYNLGPEGETYPYFDDVDDYNGLNKSFSTTDIPSINVSAQVRYVDENNPNNTTSNRTFLKKLTITLTSSYYSENIVVEHIFSYH